MSPNPLDSELESFRQQWLSEVRGRSDRPQPSASQPSSSSAQQHQHQQHTAPPPSSSAAPAAARHDDDDDYFEGHTFDEPPIPPGPTLDHDAADAKELVSALDHFEEAMEREAQGNMGDSLKLYRKAYKLDNGVDRRYREKHFPAGKPKPKQPAPAPAQAQQPAAKHAAAATAAPGEPSAPSSIADLLSSFSSLTIEGVPPPVEGMPAPPCPISTIPDEILVHVMRDVAVTDVAEFARLSLVCRRMAYLVSAEQAVWRRVSLGTEFGFPAMHHRWGVSVDWKPLDEPEHVLGETVVSPDEKRRQEQQASVALTRSLVPSPAYPDWRTLFRARPRIRFNGCYISTVNYVRSGAASTNQATWGGAPIHIVTYYRYLRLFRDGAAISLLTTDEPRDVVHHLTRDQVDLARDRKHHHHNHHNHHQHTQPQVAAPGALPTPVMSLALKGRWRVSPHPDDPEADPDEGNLYVETEGVGPKYTYRMDLSLRSAGKSTRNNKLVWRGFYSYNKLTDDWAEFGLKNDKPFFFSRVKSYGIS